MLMPFGSAYHREQYRHRHPASADHLSGLRPVHHLHRAAGRPGQRRLRQISDLLFGSAMSVVMVLIYTHLGHVTLTTAIVVNVLMFVGIFSRMIPSQALISAIPDPASAARSARSARRCSSSPAGSGRSSPRRSSRKNRTVRCGISTGSATSSSRRRSSRWSRCISCRSRWRSGPARAWSETGQVKTRRAGGRRDSARDYEPCYSRGTGISISWAWANGAQERTRTFTAVKPLAPEASASTNSATWARAG